MALTAHLIGLCGAGMSAVGRLLQEKGYIVTGSDEGFYPPVSDYLTTIDLVPHTPYAKANLPDAPDMVVIGKNARLVPDTNEEVAAAFERMPDTIRSFPEVLAALTKDRTRTVVAGSYGKSSLTGLITFCLQHAGLNPGYFIGAIPKDMEHSSALGGDGPFIFEGDEYPSANWDERSKFLHYDPDTVVLTSATHDHINIFPTLASYHEPFHKLLMAMSERAGTLVACVDETYAASFFHAYPGPKISYGLESGANFSACHIQLGDPAQGNPTTFSLCVGIDTHPDFTTTLMGRHAVENICGAAAYLIGQNLLTVEAFRDAVAAFSGLTRRLDRKAEDSALVIYEGFGSSYEKARAAISAMKEHFPQRRLVILFEPHTFTWRNKAALAQYDTAFDGAGCVWVFRPPTQGADTHDQANLDDILARARGSHPDVREFTPSTTSEILDDLSTSDDVVLILSSGSFDGGLSPLLRQAAEQYPADTGPDSVDEDVS